MKQVLNYRTVLLSNMFRDFSDGIEEYTTSVTDFINKCIKDVGPTVTVRTYPNRKQSGVNREYRRGLSTHPWGAPVLTISVADVATYPHRLGGSRQEVQDPGVER